MSVGIDLVYMPRFEGKEALAKRILSGEEYAMYEKRLDKTQFLAGRFAAKEAFLKAYRDGVGRIPFTAISITYNDMNAPVLYYESRAYDVSISHDGQYAVAIVIIKE